MLAFSEGESLHTVRGCRKLHSRLLNSVAFSDKADLGGNRYIIAFFVAGTQQYRIGPAIQRSLLYIMHCLLLPQHGVDDHVDVADVDLPVTRYITIIRRVLAEHHVDN